MATSGLDRLTTAGAAPDEPVRGVSQWAIIGRELRKRRLAMLCCVLVVLVITISVFAPFLANDRPIAYFGYNRAEYQDALRNARTLMAQLITPPRDASGEEVPVDPTKQHRLIDRQLDSMAAAVDAETANRLEDFSNALQTACASDTIDTAAITELRNRLRRDFDDRSVALVEQWQFPVLASLSYLDLVFMTGVVLFLLTPLWRLLLIRTFGRGHPAIARVSAGVLLLLPVLSGLLWWVLVPERVDRTDYKHARMTDAPEQDLPATPVVFSQVMWPPVPYGLDENELSAKLLPPAWWDSGNAQPSASRNGHNGLPPAVPHWLGTDSLGRDVLCRMIWGGRVSLAVGIVAVSIYVVLGILIGALAGYFRGAVDIVISRFIEIVICFPSFFLILTIVAFVGPSIFNIMVVIGLTRWTSVARLVRGEFLRLTEQDFVLAARSLGYSPRRIIFRHVLPNAMAPVLVAATFGIAGAILTESALSFLGFGITIPKPSWGGILADGRSALFRAPWLIYFPGFAIFITITCYNLVGEAFRDAADPRLRDGKA